MANIFGDVGRSNLFQTGQALFGDAMKVGQQELQGNMAVLQVQEAQKRSAILQAEEARKSQEDAQKQDMLAKEKAFQEKPFNIKFSPLLSQHQDSEDYQQKFEQLRQVMGADEMGNTTHGNVLRGTTEMLKSPDMIKEWFKPRLDSLEQEIHANKDKLYKAQISGDAESVKKLSAIDQKLTDTYLMKSGEYGKKLLATEKDAIAERRLDQADRKADETERSNQAKESAMDRRLGIMEDTAKTNAKKALSQGKELSFGDKEVLRAMGKNMPKTQTLARTADKNIQKIDRMAALVDRGAGGVRGDLLAKINKAADLFRRTSPEDAKYNVLKSEMMGLAGSLRLQLGLTGTTSDKDVQVMQEAAGMGTPAESQKALLSGYRQGFMQDINNYNSDAEAYSNYSKASKSIYKPITVQSAGASGPSVVETRKTKDGRTLEKLSDGTIREKK